MTADELKAWAKKAILSEVASAEVSIGRGGDIDKMEGLLLKHRTLLKLAAHVDTMSVVVVDKEA